MNLELMLVPVSPPTRGRGIPLLFTSKTSESGWLERAARIAVMTTGHKAKSH